MQTIKTIITSLLILLATSVFAQNTLPPQSLFTNVLIENNLIKKVNAATSDAHADATIIDAPGKILMPGLIRKFMYRSDLVGISANWGSPPDKSLEDQTTIEAFWRFQFSQGFAITPSLQLLLDPALNPAEDKVWVFGLRARLAF